MISSEHSKHTARGFPGADERARRQDTARAAVGEEMVRKCSRVLVEKVWAKPRSLRSALAHISPTAAFGRKVENEVVLGAKTLKNLVALS